MSESTSGDRWRGRGEGRTTSGSRGEGEQRRGRPPKDERRRKNERRRGRPPTIDREAVLGAALRLLDAEGVDALTMRRLARELGVSAMALVLGIVITMGAIDGPVGAASGLDGL